MKDHTDVGNTGVRSIPSVHWVLEELGAVDLPRPVVLHVIRRELAAMRSDVLRDADTPMLRNQVVTRVRGAINSLMRKRIQAVINATGIIIHTNLGRAPLSAGASHALAEVASNFCNLEYDLDAGERGSRGSYAEQSLAILCDAEAAMVVNNCAASLVLMLRHFASRKPRRKVIISRGELVQIGGGFRVPDILRASGARLCEVGTTNQTTVEDYRAALDDRAALILRVHRSNFYMDGFVSSPSTVELAALAREAQVPLVEDLGSGAMFDTSAIAGEAEPMPAASIRGGADLVCFSGDKLLGGPQAGIIAGRSRYVSALKKEPLFRALRCDKLILTALEATVDQHLSGAAAELPIGAMMSLSIESLRARAEHIVAAVAGRLSVEVGTGEARVGGGTLPRTRIPSVTLDLIPPDGNPAGWAEALRRHRIPIIGYVSGDRLKLDLRTVFEHQDQELLQALLSLASPPPCAAGNGTPVETS